MIDIFVVSRVVLKNYDNLTDFQGFSTPPCPQIEIQKSGSAKCVIITPNSDVPVKFGWNKFDSVEI